MQDRDYPLERVNTVANYAILSQADNAELTGRTRLTSGGRLNQTKGSGRRLSCFSSPARIS